MTDSFGCVSPQEADFTVIPSLSRDLKALVMREIPRQARNDIKDFYRITLVQPKESVMPLKEFRGSRFCALALFIFGSSAESLVRSELLRILEPTFVTLSI